MPAFATEGVPLLVPDVDQSVSITIWMWNMWYFPKIPQEFEWNNDNSPVDLRFDPQPAVTVTGEDGAPVAGATWRGLDVLMISIATILMALCTKHT